MFAVDIFLYSIFSIEIYLFVRSKLNTDDPTKLLFIYQSKNMERLYRRYGCNLLLMDATYKTTRYALPLFLLVVKTNVNYQVRNLGENILTIYALNLLIFACI